MNPVSNVGGSAAVNPAVNPFAGLGGAGGGGAGGVAADAAANASQDRFMTLLVAQMKNQDPLNPMDNAQVTSQIAQINTVKGIDQLNQTVQKLLGNADAAQSMQAAALIGHTALVAGKSIELIGAGGVNGADGVNGTGGASGTGGFSLAGAAEEVTVTISAASGQVVHRAQLGGLGAGLHHFTWDGKTGAGAAAQPGAYTFAVTARSGGSNAAAAETLSALRIDGVTPGAAGAGGPALQLRGAPPVQINQVRQFF